MNPDQLPNLPEWTTAIFAATTFGSVIFWFTSKAARKEREELLRGTIVDQKTRIAELEAERNMYREKAHMTAQEAQATQLRIVELESRPDLGRILEKEEQWHEKRQEFYAKLFGIMEKMNSKLDSELHTMAAALSEMTKRLDIKGSSQHR